MLKKERLRQYKICKERGHKTSAHIYENFPITKYICRYCETVFWEEVSQHEDNIPT